MIEKKTSQEWFMIDNIFNVIDPDGWDRKNFQYSWYEEKITYKEFKQRAMASTCMIDQRNIND